MKLAIVVGHNRQSQGAVRSDTGESEWIYNSTLAAHMVEASKNHNIQAEIFFRAPGLGYSREIAQVYSEVDEWGADASIELHFNSHGDPTASGTETLSSGSARSVELAEEVHMAMVEDLGLRDRGVKVHNRRTKGRGYKSLVAGSAPAILVEPFFGSSAKGKRASDNTHERVSLAEAIVEGAARAMSGWV